MIELCKYCGERVFFTDSTCPNCGRCKNETAGGDTSFPVTQASPSQPVETGASRHFWMAMLLIMLAAFSFLADWNIVANGGSIDLRNRVTGARLLAAGMDPYTTKWKKGDPERFCDLYDHPSMPVTKTTVTPSMLMVGGWVAVLPYNIGRHLWWLAQWLLLAGVAILGATHPGVDTRSRWAWLYLCVLFTWTLSWRMHIDRGQGYILWVFLAVLWLRGSLHPAQVRRWIWIAGVAAGLLVALRPPMALAVAPFLLFRARGQIPVAAIAFGIAFLLPMFARPDIWLDYFNAMKSWSELYRMNQQPSGGGLAYPMTIEGMDIYHMAKYVIPKFVDSSAHRLFISISESGTSTLPLLPTFLLCAAAWIGFALRKLPDLALLTGLIALTFIADTFLPAYRYAYNDVFILNLALLTCFAKRQSMVWWAILAAIIGFSILLVYAAAPPKTILYGPPLVFLILAAARLMPKRNLNPITSSNK